MECNLSWKKEHLMGIARRHFLFGIAAPAAIRAVPRKPVKITRIRVTQIQGRFHKFVAMNSYDTEPKGHTYLSALLRIETDQGVEGVGVGSSNALSPAAATAMRRLIGANPLELYQSSRGHITAHAPAEEALLRRYMWLDGPLFDLIGKLEGKPCWKLFGEAHKERVEVYDGTIYFADLWFRDRAARAVLEEAEEAVRSGYRGIKLKIGRGAKWMETEAGLRRDIEVLNATRKAIGPEAKLLADANNGYRGDFDRAWRLMEGTAESKLHWMEEIFPENVEDYTRLRGNMQRAGIRTLIADGETATFPADMLPYLQPKRLVDVVQLDVRKSGLVGNLEMARLAGNAGAQSVPHNWASRVGTLAGLHLAKASPYIPAAEDDRSTYDAIVADGYRFRDGFYTIPDEPGFGILVNEKVYADKYRAGEVVIA